MKRLVVCAALAALCSTAMPGVALGHGGTYKGPGDTVPPGGTPGGGGVGPAPGTNGPTTPGSNGPSTPGPLVPGSPGAGSASSPSSPTSSSGADITMWEFWWGFNQAPYLRLKDKIHSAGATTGSDGFFLGKGEGSAKQSLRPTERQVREVVVPALLHVLETETNNDIVTGALVALAKIGDAKSESGESEFERVIASFLADANTEIAETAAVSLGILGNERSIPTLHALLADSAEGRALTKSKEVPYRTRSFAAYGLGLLGERAAEDVVRKDIVAYLHEVLESDRTSTHDLSAACILSMGLVHIEDAGTSPDYEGEALAPGTSRGAQLAYLLDYLGDDTRSFVARAHCPTSLARLLDGMPDDGPTGRREAWRKRIVDDLLQRISSKSKERDEVVQSAVLALGELGTAGSGELDVRIRSALADVPSEWKDAQIRAFSMIAMAHAGGGAAADSFAGIEQTGAHLLQQFARGKAQVQPWAGMAMGVFASELAKSSTTHPVLVSMGDAIRDALRRERNGERIGALAIAAGISHDQEAAEILRNLFERTSDDNTRGYVAVGLGLIGDTLAVAPIQSVLEKSQYRPVLLRQAAIALGLLGDKDLVGSLVKMLDRASGLGSQAAIASALGFIGDRDSIEPLIAMMNDGDKSGRARGFAAVALGIIASKDNLPWNTPIGLGVNYRASTSTLTGEGTGILDIL